VSHYTLRVVIIGAWPHIREFSLAVSGVIQNFKTGDMMPVLFDFVAKAEVSRRD